MIANAWRRTFIITLLVGTLFLAACSGVQVTEHSLKNNAYSAAQPGANEQPFNLAIVGVDFDPPLTYVENIRQQGVTLLAAVENRGKGEAKDIRIVARLILDAEHHKVIQREGVLPPIAPGQMRVYRFPRLTSIPIRRSYTLDLRLLTPDGQQVLSQRTYTLKASK